MCIQVAAVREGMSWIIPVPLLSLLTAKQLEQMVCGLPEISVEVLKKVVRYREVDEQHQLAQWFWKTLEEFSNEERVLFMRFVSGRSRLPANTADISQRFQIMKVDRVRAFYSLSAEGTLYFSCAVLMISLMTGGSTLVLSGGPIGKDCWQRCHRELAPYWPLHYTLKYGNQS